ncbi:MAG: ribosome maturation factor RimM [Acidobacteriota bacterium]
MRDLVGNRLPRDPAAQERASGFVLIGEVDRVRGLDGEVVVTVHSDDPRRMSQLAAVFVEEGEGTFRRLEIEGVKRLHERSVVKLAGIGSNQEAKGLVGRGLFIRKEASTPPPQGQYYAYQLVGLEARQKDGSAVGPVVEVLRQGPQSLLVIRTPEGDKLVPFVPEICVNVDLDGASVTIDPPAGLLDL